MADDSRAMDAGTRKDNNAGRDNGRTHEAKDAAAMPAGDGNLIMRIARELQNRIGPQRYRAWFDTGTTQLRITDGRLQVDSKSQFVANWIDRHFSEELRTVARQALGDDADIHVTVAPARSPERPGDDEAPPPPERAVRHGDDVDGGPAPRPRRGRSTSPAARMAPAHAGPRVALRSLDDFVVGDSNRLAFTAAERMAECAGTPEALALLIYGDCGVGKTHLLQGICERYAKHCRRPNAVRYITAEQFTNEYITAVREGTLTKFRREYRRLELLAIDDVHFLASKTSTQNEFLHTMDAIDLSGARIVLASDQHPRNINQLNPALVSRLVSRLVVRIDPPDRTTRVAIVKKLAAQRGLRLLDAAAESIASRCTGSVRDIQGVLAQLAAMQSMSGADPSAEIGTLITDRLFREHDPVPRVGPVRISAIIDAVCDLNGIDRSDLFGRSRHARVVLGRGLVTHLARELTSHSYPEIAQALGRSCHSTVHAAARRIEQTLQLAEQKVADGEHANQPGGGPAPTEVRAMVEELRARILRSANRRGGDA